ncbi:hypothetical protein WMY93_011400 [Mugilogobius chulae]|uniref:J domain-containing protein n=1 Tax=Mugilogobius chulae TaxID=88201 RepID=A0AAW0PBG6_9GOBI
MAQDGEEKELDLLAEGEETFSNWDTSMGENVDEEMKKRNYRRTKKLPQRRRGGSHGGDFDELDPDGENMQDDDDQKEMNGESGWRNAGRKGKVRSSGSISETNPAYFSKGSGVPRHKQARRRNHHHHQQNRGRRRTGNQLLASFKEMLSESLFCALAFLAFLWIKGVAGRIGGERGKRVWTYIQESRFWQKLVGLMEKVRNCFRRKSAPSSPESPGQGVRGAPGQELERLLALADVPEEELDPFSVLGVEVHATDAELKKAYRQLAVQVHPDKNKHPRAGEAFKVLRAAWDIVSNPETRREYEIKRMAASELSKSMNEFLTKLQDDLKEAMNTMMCTKCEGKHKRFEMDREPSEARFCAECNRCHSAEEGDLWAESSMLGLRITYFACMDGKVYDITEWAGCQRISISPDTHRVPYHISLEPRTAAPHDTDPPRSTPQAPQTRPTCRTFLTASSKEPPPH